MAKLPPGPKLSALQSFKYMRDPYAFYESLRRHYSDPITVPTMNGTLVITWHAEGIKEIFTAKPETFGVFGTNSMAPVLGEKSLLCASGGDHVSRRKLMTPPFHGERMHQFGDKFKAISLRHAGRLEPGKSFLMQDVAQAITLEAIVQAVFGIEDEGEIAVWSSALSDLIGRINPATIFFEFLRRDFGGRGPWAKFVAARDRLDGLVSAEIKRRRALGTPGQDMFSMMMMARFDDGAVMGDTELRDQLITLLLAGHETTSTAIAWTFYWMHRHPQVRERLLAELAELGPDPEPMALTKLPYLEAVCHESLRLNPIAPDVARSLLKPFTLRGWELPAGINVGVSIALAHTNPDIFEDPLTFRPERFLERTYSPFEFLPFGGGARRCIGSAFALYQMKVVVATLLQHYELSRPPEGEEVPKRRHLTTGPKDGVEMVLVGGRS